MHSARHLVENCFFKPKPFRAIATHYDEIKRNFLVGIHLTASTIPFN